MSELVLCVRTNGGLLRLRLQLLQLLHLHGLGYCCCCCSCCWKGPKLFLLLLLLLLLLQPTTIIAACAD